MTMRTTTPTNSLPTTSHVGDDVRGEVHDAWAIVGGGTLGLTLALRLAQRGVRVTLYEASDHLGGLADAWQLGSVTWDRHYHVTLLSDTHLRSVLAELDLDQEMQWVETKTGFFTNERLYSVSNSWEFLRFPPLGLVDKLRLGWTMFYGSKVKNWRRLEQIPVTDWLIRLSGRRTFAKMWLPLLRAKLGDNYQQTSAAFIWATIARLYAARRTGLKKEMFGYLPGGYARIIARWQDALEQHGVDIRLSQPVSGVATTAGNRVVVRTPTDETTFARTVLTVPSPIVSRLVPDLTPEEHTRHRAIQYQGIICASLLMREPLSEFYVTNITDETVPFTGVIEMTALVDRAQFGGRSLVYLPKYLPRHDPMWEWSDGQVQQEFVAGLCRIHPGLDPARDIEAFRISRVPQVMALPTLGYSRKLPPSQTSLPGIHVVNAAQIVNGTLNVNETVKLAEAAVQEWWGAGSDQFNSAEAREVQ